MILQKPSIKPRTKRNHYHQGLFLPNNPKKYIGNINDIRYRSKWELQFLKWCDSTDAVIRYSSEQCVIPYISPIDGKRHHYFVDFFVSVLQSDGSIKEFLVEIKPYSQCIPPKPTKKNPESSVQFQEAIKTYLINQAKWKQANAICKKHGWEFMILTENELFKTRKRVNGKTKKRT